MLLHWVVTESLSRVLSLSLSLFQLLNSHFEEENSAQKPLSPFLFFSLRTYHVLPLIGAEFAALRILAVNNGQQHHNNHKEHQRRNCRREGGVNHS